jgi:hypothetical protein
MQSCSSSQNGIILIHPPGREIECDLLSPDIRDLSASFPDQQPGDRNVPDPGGLVQGCAQFAIGHITKIDQGLVDRIFLTFLDKRAMISISARVLAGSSLKSKE